MACRAEPDAATPKRRGDGRPRKDTMSTRKGKSHGVSHLEAQKVSARPAAHIVVGLEDSSAVSVGLKSRRLRVQIPLLLPKRKDAARRK